MKKGLIIFAAMIALSAAIAYASDPIINYTGNGSASVDVDYNILDFTTIYHYDAGSGVGRNMDYPTYEYIFRGDRVHFWAKIDANSVYALENAVVQVRLTRTCNALPPVLVNLSFVTGIGATYNPSTGRYEGEFEGDFIVPSTMASGNYEITAHVLYYGTEYKADNLMALKYQNVNDLLVLGVSDIHMDLQLPEGLMFNLVPLQFNMATDYPKHLTITTPVDREGQGVIGNISLAVSNYVGTCPNGATDVITADYIRMSITGDLGSWVWLASNPAPLGPHSIFNAVATNQATIGSYLCPNVGGNYATNLFFQLYFEANHCAPSYEGGAIALKYAIY